MELEVLVRHLHDMAHEAAVSDLLSKRNLGLRSSLARAVEVKQHVVVREMLHGRVRGCRKDLVALVCWTCRLVAAVELLY